MTDFISREAAIKVIQDYGKGAISDGMTALDPVGDIVSLARAMEWLDAADVAPVRHGQWIKKQNPQWKAYSHDCCSICGWWNTKNALCYDAGHKPGHSLNYCPNCGARMDGGKANETD